MKLFLFNLFFLFLNLRTGAECYQWSRRRSPAQVLSSPNTERTFSSSVCRKHVWGHWRLKNFLFKCFGTEKKQKEKCRWVSMMRLPWRANGARTSPLETQPENITRFYFALSSKPQKAARTLVLSSVFSFLTNLSKKEHKTVLPYGLIFLNTHLYAVCLCYTCEVDTTFPNLTGSLSCYECKVPFTESTLHFSLPKVSSLNP